MPLGSRNGDRSPGGLAFGCVAADQSVVHPSLEHGILVDDLDGTDRRLVTMLALGVRIVVGQQFVGEVVLKLDEPRVEVGGRLAVTEQVSAVRTSPSRSGRSSSLA